MGIRVHAPMRWQEYVVKKVSIMTEQVQLCEKSKFDGVNYKSDCNIVTFCCECQTVCISGVVSVMVGPV